MTISPFGKLQYKSLAGTAPRLDEATLRDFSGGLNLVDNDVAIKSNYAKVLMNMHKDVDGGQSLRWGTSFKWDLTGTVTGNIIEQYYFNSKLLCFTDTGQIATIDSAGTKVAIWNSTIANALPAHPAGWSSGLTTIDVTEFKGELVVCNGVDKPVLVSATFTVKYLQDIPTGSNVNVPIGSFVTTVVDYTIIGGIPATPFQISISAKGTSGTWAGDAAPNDALSINVGAYAPAAGGPIRALSSFRNFLLVHFAQQTVVIELGVYNAAGNHTPKPNDTIPDYGIISHRVGIALNQDFIFADAQSVQTAKRNLFGGALEASSLADKIIPAFTGATPTATADRNKSFAVYNKLENRIMFFLNIAGTYSIFTMSFDKTVKQIAWSQFSGWNFTCGCGSERGRIYFARGSKVYQYGNGVFTNEAYVGDEVNAFDGAWTTATAYVVGQRETQGGKIYICLVNHTSGTFSADLASKFWVEYLGYPITFDWELPWSDINTRMRKKQVKFIGMDTTGTGTFTISAFVDNIYKDVNNAYDPAVTMDFVGGSSPGYGGGDQPYGGGRRGIEERSWGFPLEFKLFKLRINGSTVGRLKFSTLTILYKRGTYHR